MTIDDIALTLDRNLNLKTVVHLLECFGSAQAIYGASNQQLADIAELKPEVAARLSAKQYHKQAEKEMQHIKKHKIQSVESTEQNYPALLKECCDYPHLLYGYGDMQILNDRMLTMVGTRNITNYGARMCDEIIRELALTNPDLVIVSGLAFGIDIACHISALRYGLRTVAVVPSCLPEIAPKHHSEYARDIVRKGGCILSEFNTGHVIRKWTFGQRNRVLAGMSAGTVVVEATQSSGSLNTAAIADGYNRTLMAVPGRVDDKSSWGCNDLIRRMKARLVCSGAAIAEEMGWAVGGDLMGDTQRGFDTSSLDKDQAGLYNFMKTDVLYSMDELLDSTGIKINILMTLLLELEVLGFVRTVRNTLYEKLY